MKINVLFLAGLIVAITANHGLSQTPGQLKWSSTTQGAVFGSPAISGNGGEIYITSEDGNLYAINQATGHQDWVVDLHNTGGYGGDELISSPVVAPNGSIYVASLDGNLYDINPSNGSVEWAVLLDNYLPTLAVGSSVAIGFDGTVYVTFDDDALYAVNPTGNNGTGEMIGEERLSQYLAYVDSCPTVGPDGTVYVFGGSSVNNAPGELVAVNCVECGGVKWAINLQFDPEDNDDFRFAPVVDSDGTIYVPYGSSGDELIAINPSDGSPKWNSPFATGSGNYIFSSPAIGPNGTLYFGDQNGTLYAVNSADGSLKWKYVLCSSGMAIKDSPAVASDGTTTIIYAGSEDGHMYALQDNGSSASLAWTYPAPGLPSLAGEVESSPAVGSDGTVYFGCDDNNVYAVDGAGALASSFWPMFRKNVAHTASDATTTYSGPAIIDQNFNPSVNGNIFCMALQPNGQIIIGGDISQVDGVSCYNLARLNPDGTLDSSFTSAASTTITQYFWDVYAVGVDVNGNIYVAGDGPAVTDPSDYQSGYILRLNSDGSLDTSFSITEFVGDEAWIQNLWVPPTYNISADIIVGGGFNSYDGATTWGPNNQYPIGNSGSVMMSNGAYDWPFFYNDGWVESFQILGANNSFLVGGGFDTLNGQPCDNVGMVNVYGAPNGVVNLGADFYVYGVGVQSDSKMLATGMFSTVGQDAPNAHPWLARFNSNGSVDETFNPILNDNGNCVIQDDAGGILVGGAFDMQSTLGGLARFNSNGTLDSTFNLGVSGTVYCLLQYPNGPILVGGQFASIGGQTQANLARICVK